MTLKVDNLSVEIATAERVLRPVDGVSFSVGKHECVALLGESGCGKSLTALALMRLLPEGGYVAGGELTLGDESLFALTEAQMRAVRGSQLGMIFQEPMTSLNPVMTVAAQIDEVLRMHRRFTATAARAEAAKLMADVGLDAGKLEAYPFQLSGGQRQRALLAMMLAGEPKVLIADEPTTALDVSVQAQILRLLKSLQQSRGMGLLLITHDLDVASDMADRVAVMYAGQIVEWAPRDALYAKPQHPYTQKLFAVLPRIDRRGERLDSLPGRVPAPDAALPGCRFAPRCPQVFARCHNEVPVMTEITAGHAVRCHLVDQVKRGEDSGEVRHEERARLGTGEAQALAKDPVLSKSFAKEGSTHEAVPVLQVNELSVHFPNKKGVFKRTVSCFKAVDGVSLQVSAGETLALVGESGCGKSTLARAILRLQKPTAGQVKVCGKDLSTLDGHALRQKRREMQIVFQDPFSSLNPRMKVGSILEEGMVALLPELSALERSQRIFALLEQVGLPADALQRYPHEFSGGQRQRIAIARALAVEPKLLILDEPTSALDVSVQAQILNLLTDIQADRGLAYLFITHNLSVVGYLAHRVAVMQAGRIVESGETSTVLTAPQSDITRQLLAAAPGKGAQLTGST